MLKLFRIKFQWSKDKQNRIRPSAGGRTRRKSHKPNNKLRPERAQQRYNNQENDSVSNDNAVASPSYSDVPVQIRSDQKGYRDMMKLFLLSLKLYNNKEGQVTDPMNSEDAVENLR